MITYRRTNATYGTRGVMEPIEPSFVVPVEFGKVCVRAPNRNECNSDIVLSVMEEVVFVSSCVVIKVAGRV